MKPNAIEMSRLDFGYGGGPRVLEAVTLEVPEGEFFGIIGPNGGGKTTLLKIIMGMLAPTCAEHLKILQKNPRAARPYIGYVPQHAGFQRGFPIVVEDVVATGRLTAGRLIGPYSAADRHAARQSLTRVGAADLARDPVFSLSGGQLQRVLIARALVSAPRLLILDEPTAYVDLKAETDIFELLKDMTPRVTIIVVSHDVGFISQYVSRVACLNRRLLCHETACLSGEMIDALYGRHVHMIQHGGRAPHSHEGGGHAGGETHG